MRLMDYVSPYRYINITGVGDLTIPSLKIGNFASKVQLQDGRHVIMIFHEYGELLRGNTGKTIHSKIRLAYSISAYIDSHHLKNHYIMLCLQRNDIHSSRTVDFWVLHFMRTKDDSTHKTISPDMQFCYHPLVFRVLLDNHVHGNCVMKRGEIVCVRGYGFLDHLLRHMSQHQEALLHHHPLLHVMRGDFYFLPSMIALSLTLGKDMLLSSPSILQDASIGVRIGLSIGAAHETSCTCYYTLNARFALHHSHDRMSLTSTIDRSTLKNKSLGTDADSYLRIFIDIDSIDCALIIYKATHKISKNFGRDDRKFPHCFSAAVLYGHLKANGEPVSIKTKASFHRQASSIAGYCLRRLHPNLSRCVEILHPNLSRCVEITVSSLDIRSKNETTQTSAGNGMISITFQDWLCTATKVYRRQVPSVIFTVLRQPSDITKFLREDIQYFVALRHEKTLTSSHPNNHAVLISGNAYFVSCASCTPRDLLLLTGTNYSVFCRKNFIVEDISSDAHVAYNTNLWLANNVTSLGIFNDVSVIKIAPCFSPLIDGENLHDFEIHSVINGCYRPHHHKNINFVDYETCSVIQDVATSTYVAHYHQVNVRFMLNSMLLPPI
eukprot:scaffold5762_cov86-Skeletonema_menzelii.AAC.1